VATRRSVLQLFAPEERDVYRLGSLCFLPAPLGVTCCCSEAQKLHSYGAPKSLRPMYKHLVPLGPKKIALL